MDKRKKILCISLYTLCGIVLTLGSLIFRLSIWIQDVYGVEFAEVLYTITSPLQGTGGNMVWVTIRDCLLPVLPVPILYTLFVVFGVFRLAGKKPAVGKVAAVLVPVVSLAVFVGGVIHTEQSLGLLTYLRTGATSTDIYELHYVDPKEIKLTPPEEKKNLILVYLESMETTYASVEEGGFQPVNYIPNMTRLAKENISFSDSELLGGFRMTGKTTWTMAALFATSSGLPFSFPVEGNSMGQEKYFAPGATTLGDILLGDGYINEFLCGSDVNFGGRKQFYEQHGDYTLYDLFTARKEGVIPEDYYHFWGFEDYILYDIAKEELTRLAQGDQPFNFTMLTVDPHHTGGYVCEQCGTDFKDATANVIACADRQLQQFIDWCKEQPFYENTVIVLMGDHPRMDTCLVEGVQRVERTMYNCFLNTDTENASAVTNRIFSSMDMFPTILAAMGYEIEGNRLGLGTNLFSGEQTLSELLGYESYNQELFKNSRYFEKKFQ